LPNIPSGKGKRIVILHAGSAESGFIEGCELVFLGIHDENGDYHSEMNTVLFMSWFDKLLQRLEQPSVIVDDNASYHNARTEETRAPNMSARKDVLCKWLSDKKIPFIPSKPKLNCMNLSSHTNSLLSMRLMLGQVM
jgi:hypothetical protein